MKKSNISDYNKTRSEAELTRLKLKSEWNRLWDKKYDDKKTAEGISTEKYPKIDVNVGQVIYATKKYKSLDFYEILEEKIGKDYYNKIAPSPKEGGWKKFAKENFSKKSFSKEPKISVDLNQHQRKHGKGWLNKIRINKKIKNSREKLD